MAQVTPGPLVSSIHGSIAGTTFITRGGQTVVRARSTPCRKSTAPLSTARRLMAQASTAWSGLTDDARTAWENLAVTLVPPGRRGSGRPFSGFGLFCAALAHQAGRLSAIIPAVPAAYESLAPCSPTVIATPAGLNITALSRNLATGESLLVRALREVPPHVARPPYRLANAVECFAGEGLSTTPQMALAVASGNNLPGRVGLFTWGTTLTYEGWFYLSSSAPAGERFVFNGSSPYKFLGYNAGSWRVFDNGTQTALGTYTLTKDRWHYIASVHNGGAGTYSLYIDGALIFGPIARGSGALVNWFYIGKLEDGSGAWLGAVDEFRISTKARTGAEIAAAWNSGRGRPFTLDADTLALYHLDSAAGTTLADASSHHLDMTAPTPTFTAGAFDPLLFPTSKRALALPVKVLSIATPGKANLFLSPPTYTLHNWT